MPLQTKIQKYPAPGAPGDKASLNRTVYASHNYLVTPGQSVDIGSFVWRDPSGRGTVSNSGAGLPLGFVERWQAVFQRDPLREADMAVPGGSPVHVAVQGRYYAQASTPAQIGHKVYAGTIDGSLQTADAGAVMADAVETGWHVVDGGNAGDIITISTWKE